jgi:hypothetical protein
VSFYVSTANFFLLHCDEWDRVVALPRHKFVTGATLLQLVMIGNSRKCGASATPSCPLTRTQHCICIGQSKRVCLKPYNLSYLFVMVVSFKCLFPLSRPLLKLVQPHFTVHLCLPLPHFSAPLQSLPPLSGTLKSKAFPYFPIHSYGSVY